MKKTKFKKNILIPILSFAALFIIAGLYNPLSVSRLSLSSEKIERPVKIALISDLHSCRYGRSQSKLIEAIDRQKPDIICLAGDIFDDKRPDANASEFLSRVSEKYPCYYVTGNHEHRADDRSFAIKMELLDKYGVVRLKNESRIITVNGQQLALAGVDDPRGHSYSDMSGVLFGIKENIPDDLYSVLISHRPEKFELYAECGFDLTLCGHAHGGQWRIPFLLENGLLAPGQGMFPEYTNGKYSSGDSSMIVSRGLAKENTIVPRFYNRPEIVLIELKKDESSE